MGGVGGGGRAARPAAAGRSRPAGRYRRRAPGGTAGRAGRVPPRGGGDVPAGRVVARHRRPPAAPASGPPAGGRRRRPRRTARPRVRPRASAPAPPRRGRPDGAAGRPPDRHRPRRLQRARPAPAGTGHPPGPAPRVDHRRDDAARLIGPAPREGHRRRGGGNRPGRRPVPARAPDGLPGRGRPAVPPARPRPARRVRRGDDRHRHRGGGAVPRPSKPALARSGRAGRGRAGRRCALRRAGPPARPLPLAGPAGRGGGPGPVDRLARLPAGRVEAAAGEHRHRPGPGPRRRPQARARHARLLRAPVGQGVLLQRREHGRLRRLRGRLPRLPRPDRPGHRAGPGVERVPAVRRRARLGRHRHGRERGLASGLPRDRHARPVRGRRGGGRRAPVLAGGRPEQGPAPGRQPGGQVRLHDLLPRSRPPRLEAAPAAVGRDDQEQAGRRRARLLDDPRPHLRPGGRGTAPGRVLRPQRRPGGVLPVRPGARHRRLLARPHAARPGRAPERAARLRRRRDDPPRA